MSTVPRDLTTARSRGPSYSFVDVSPLSAIVDTSTNKEQW